ncbi:hypothetical protein [Candidatus Pelagibacter communis]|uniref:hypothetical protein n=1 Tax=Pelagibacter ubique TaxID=198252 RepID=UPI00094CEC1D|nr:hypothetical protein [Candidatus Pelagibacter ubique]
MLNNLSIIFLLIFFFTSKTFSNEPTDIWKLEKEEEKTLEIKSKDKPKSIKIETQNSATSNKSEIITQENFTNTNDMIVGIYDPNENGLTIDMWQNSNEEKVYGIKKKINRMNLSDDANRLYQKILLTNAYPPNGNKEKKIFFDLKEEWLIKNGDLELIENYVTKNLNIISNENLIKFVLDEYLSKAEIKDACNLFEKINQNFNDYYLKNFSIYCLIHNKKNDLATMRFDLEKESGYSDPFFEKKFNSLMGLSKDDNTSSDKNLLNLHLSFKTIKDFKYVPTKKTSKLFWTYLRSNNLLDSTSDIDTTDEKKISLLEKATHERNYNEKDLFNVYKKFQFSIDQLLNVETEKENLSNIKSRALMYQGILLNDDPNKVTQLSKDLKLSFIKDGLENAFKDELRFILKGFKESELNSDLTDFYVLNSKTENPNKKIKYNNKILHQSKIINYFIQEKPSKKKAEKDLNNFLKKIKKSKKNYLITKDVIVIESLKFDGIEVNEEYKDLYTINENIMPIDIQVLINDGEIGLAMLRIIEIIGEDELKNLGSETLYFLVNALNQMDVDLIRNEILSIILPVRI